MCAVRSFGTSKTFRCFRPVDLDIEDAEDLAERIGGDKTDGWCIELAAARLDIVVVLSRQKSQRATPDPPVLVVGSERSDVVVGGGDSHSEQCPAKLPQPYVPPSEFGPSAENDRFWDGRFVRRGSLPKLRAVSKPGFGTNGFGRGF